jgi:uncharacterized protein YcbX
MITGNLTQIFIYPIKSCAGLRLTNTFVTTLGLQYDRQWLIVDDTGQFQTQRQIPHLAWIEPSISHQTLGLHAPGQPDLYLAFASANSTKRTITVWRDQHDAWDMGDEASAWLDNYLEVPGRHFRLVQFDPNRPRQSDPAWSGPKPSGLQFADGFAINVLSESSIQGFNERLMEIGIEPVDALRFRPNLVVDGLDHHEEDMLDQVDFTCDAQHLIIELVKPCPRCQIPDINPLTAMAEPEITQMLSQYRQLPRMDHAICFGMNAVVRQAITSQLAVGDRFTAALQFEGRK